MKKKLTLNIFLALILSLSLSTVSSFSQPAETLYERLGGVNGIAAVVDDFIEGLLTNEVITKNENVVAALGRVTKAGLKYQVTAFICEATGGPEKYTGLPMKDSHANLNISEAEWNVSIQILKTSLGKFSVPEKEQNELISIIATAKPDIVTAKPVIAPAPPEVAPTPQAQEAAPIKAGEEFPFPDAIKPPPEAQEAPVEEFPFPDAIKSLPEAQAAPPAEPKTEEEEQAQAAPPAEPEPHIAPDVQAAPGDEEE